jgi:hypothetical protein
VVVEPDEFVPFVLGEAVVVEEIEGVAPVAVDAEVEHAHAEVVGDVGEIVFRVRRHQEGMTNDQAPMTREIPSAKFQAPIKKSAE